MNGRRCFRPARSSTFSGNWPKCKRSLKAAGTTTTFGDEALAEDCLMWASDFLAQLTNGDIRRLMLFNQGRNSVVVNQHGETIALDSLTAAQKDQVYLSLCLALLTTASRHGIWLPLVLDDPFERLDARATTALAAVLEGFSRQGHQILVFTQQREAAERLAAVGAEMCDMINLRRAPTEVVPIVASTLRPVGDVVKKRSVEGGTADVRRRRKKSAPSSRNGDSGGANHSDAA